MKLINNQASRTLSSISQINFQQRHSVTKFIIIVVVILGSIHPATSWRTSESPLEMSENRALMSLGRRHGRGFIRQFHICSLEYFMRFSLLVSSMVHHGRQTDCIVRVSAFVSNWARSIE